MTCRADVKKLIYDDIYNEFAKNRYTIVRVNDNTFRIANQQSTKGKSRAEHLRQATLIANEIKSRVYGKYGNNVDVNIEVPYYIGFPVEMTIEPLPEYIETVYAQVKPEKRTEFLTDLAFTFDPALYQQELMEDSPLKMIPYEVYEAQEKARLKEETERKAREEALKKITIDEKGQYRMFQTVSDEGLLASEKTIRDLAARMSDRIGIPVQIISDRTQEFKGKIENGTAVINLAYASLDTPVHEILGHPIIRALKNIDDNISIDKSKRYSDEYYDYFRKLQEEGKTVKQAEELANKKFDIKPNTLYQNLLKELEYGKGKEVLDRVKRDYPIKNIKQSGAFVKWLQDKGIVSTEEFKIVSFIDERGKWKGKNDLESFKKFLFENALKYQEKYYNEYISDIKPKLEFTFEDQQEEALVELLGLYTANKIDATKNLKLVSLLKQLLGRIKAFVRDILFQKEVEIDKLPDNMTVGDIADLLAYSNNKLILPGNEVIYTTPDNQQFKTYAEASKHISELAKNVEDVDLDKNISVDNIDKEIEILQKELDNFKFEIEPFNKFTDVYTKKGRLRQNYWARKKDGTTGWTGGSKETLIEPEYDGFVLDIDRGDGRFITKISDKEAEELYYAEENKFNTTTKASREKYAELETKIHNLKNNSLKGFIEKNKEYEQSKEIIEEWKRVNNIQYNPEEIYSRGQEFSSVVGAYSNFDVNLMMQNLLQHIEDNEKAGGEFTISAFTKPVDKEISHLEGGGGKIKFKIYPRSQDIKWAANIDVYSGSVWDASSKISKGKQSELLGVTYSKYPSLRGIKAVQPNLASIVDSLAHHHNELGIALTGNNFRLEYDEDIPYSTKKIIDSVNSILDQKYGKLVKPEINLSGKSKKTFVVTNWDTADIAGVETKEFNSLKEAEDFIQSEKIKYNLLNTNSYQIDEKYTKQGIQPTQTDETLKESIDSVKEKLNENNLQDEDMPFAPKEQRKEYTSQALINTKIAKLKEVAKKYPRSLIRSEVKPIGNNTQQIGFRYEDIFQKIPSTSIKPGVSELFESTPELAAVGTPAQYSQYLDSIFPDSKVKDTIETEEKKLLDIPDIAVETEFQQKHCK